MMKDREIFEQMKDHYDLGTDEIEEREVTFTLDVDSITEVSYLAQDHNNEYIAAIYDKDGVLYTLNGGVVYQEGCYLVTDVAEDDRTFYPGAEVETLANTFVYTTDGGATWFAATAVTTGTGDAEVTIYYDVLGKEITDLSILDSLEPAVKIHTLEGTEVYAPASRVTMFQEGDGYLVIVYELSMAAYEQAELKEADNMYIYMVSGEQVNDSYLVRDTDGVLITND